MLFLPVPAVLVLFTRAPFGTPASLALGIVLMLTHRLYARPFALARAATRCLWCGAAAPHGPELAIEEPLGRTVWRACSEDHGGRLRRFLGWTARHARFLKIGILGTLGVFLVAAALAAAGLLGASGHADAAAFFRLGIALTVLPLGLAGARGPESADPLRPPFPVHIQALIGTRVVMWLFRIVGVVWLAQVALHLARRF